MKRIFLEAAVLLTLALVLAGGTALVRSRHPGFFLREAPAPVIPAGAVEISLEEAVILFEIEQVLFLDARAEGEFAKTHIRGAVSRPLEAFDDWIEDFVSLTAPQQMIVTYCDGATCPLARDLAQRLFEAGFESVFYLTDGLGRWLAAGHPVEQGG